MFLLRKSVKRCVMESLSFKTILWALSVNLARLSSSTLIYLIGENTTGA